MTPGRRAKLLKLAAVHDAFVDEQLAGSEFHPEGRPEKSDYNLHYADLEADTDAFHAAAKAALGI
jgi:hypothetical protein